MLHSTSAAVASGRLRIPRTACAAFCLATFPVLLLLPLLAASPAIAAPPDEDPGTTGEARPRANFRFIGNKRIRTSAQNPPPEVAAPAAAPAADGDAAEENRGWFQRGNDLRSRTGSSTATSKQGRAGGGWFNRSAPPLSTDDPLGIVRLQIFLDQSHFGPGKIDGSLGGFTTKAVANYNRSRGIAPDNWDPVIRDASRAVREAHTTYTVRPEDWNHVGPLSYEPAEQAEKTYMCYRSMAELVSERFHTSENYLGSANSGINLSRLKTGDQILVPNVEPFLIENVASNRKFPRDTVLSSRHLIVDTREKVAFIEESGENDSPVLVAAFPITPGAERYIPYGTWNIDSMVTTPTFRYDKMMLQEGVRGEEFYMLPPGPNSPVGIFWAGLTKSGIGLHGTNNPDTIGRAQSAGCIRLANWDAIRLSQIIRPGATVEVR